jgi:GNAT superfamily N-acetyltransferase
MLARRGSVGARVVATDHKADALVVRRAGPDDFPDVLELGHRSLGWVGGARDAQFFQWKHFENPFGASPMWIALDRNHVVGFRTFLRWRFCAFGDSEISAVRAVDTATDPDYQGRGVFTRLTLGAVDELRDEGVQLIFNTPNRSSLPGYLKMGWSRVGRIPVAAMATRPRSLPAMMTARGPASLSSIELRVGERAADVFADREAVGRLLSGRLRARGLSTLRSPEFLAWRYGFEALRYRVLLAGSSPAAGIAVFRLRRRGSAVEAVVCDALTPETDPAVARALIKDLAGRSAADYLIRVRRPLVSRGPFIRLPRTGPILACRRLDGGPALSLNAWDLTMGDIELF